MRRLSKIPSDPNKAAALTVRLATEEPEPPPVSNAVISQYLATIGRKGGIKGGKARAQSLSGKRKKEIARLAAQARWGNSRNGSKD
jgi:hypothetical protein